MKIQTGNKLDGWTNVPATDRVRIKLDNGKEFVVYIAGDVHGGQHVCVWSRSPMTIDPLANNAITVRSRDQ